MEKLTLIKNKNNESIYGVIHTPPKRYLNKRDAFVFLHGWLGCKTGPHRLFVKTARSLSQLGYLCLRFDFRGRGSSQNISKVTIPTLLDDTRNIINFVIHKRKANQINLIGLSLGSIVALLAKNKNYSRQIGKIIMLSPPPYTKDIKKYSFNPLYRFNIDRDDMLLIFGEKDPIKDKAIESYKYIFGNDITKSIQEIKDSEHGFYSLLAEELIIKNIIKFIRKGK